MLFLIFTYGVRVFADGTVIFFGGHGSTATDLQAWATAAQRSPYGYEFKFIGVPWIDDTVDFNAGAAHGGAGGRKLVDYYVELIMRTHARDPDHKFIVAGHSSGSLLANEIARRLATLPRPQPDFKVCIANLDGSSGPRTRFPSLCVSGIHQLSTCTKNVSQSLGKCQGVADKINMCLHFSILNRAVTKSTNIASGYARIDPNLSWLEKLAGTDSDNISAPPPPPNPAESENSH